MLNSTEFAFQKCRSRWNKNCVKMSGSNTFSNKQYLIFRSGGLDGFVTGRFGLVQLCFERLDRRVIVGEQSSRLQLSKGFDCHSVCRLRQVLCVCLFVCLLACLLVCLLACLLVCLFACLLVCLLACLFACLLVCLFACLLVCLFACLLVCLFACLLVLLVCLFACLLVCLFAVAALAALAVVAACCCCLLLLLLVVIVAYCYCCLLLLLVVVACCCCLLLLLVVVACCCCLLLLLLVAVVVAVVVWDAFECVYVHSTSRVQTAIQLSLRMQAWRRGPVLPQTSTNPCPWMTRNNTIILLINTPPLDIGKNPLNKTQSLPDT